MKMRIFTEPNITDSALVHTIDENLVVPVNIDQIFDALERIINNYEDDRDEQQELLKKGFKGKNSDITDANKVTRKYQFSVKQIKRGEKLWDMLVNDNKAQYFCLSSCFEQFDKLKYLDELYRSIFKLKSMTVSTGSIEPDKESLKFVPKFTVTTENWLIPVDKWEIPPSEVSIASESDLKQDLDYLNNTYRLCVCASCGKLFKVGNWEDQHMKDLGFSLFKRCESCRKKRREAKLKAEQEEYERKERIFLENYEREIQELYGQTETSSESEQE